MKYFLPSKPLPVLFYLLGALLFSPGIFSQVSPQWARAGGQALVTDDLGNVYVGGSRAGINTLSDYVVTKYSGSGNEEWVARYDGYNGWDYLAAIAIDKAGNLYVTGYSQAIGTNMDIATIKYNNAGVQQWVARFNGTGNSDDRGYDIKVDKNNNVYVVGYSVTASSSLPDFATIKYNSSGAQQWVRYHNGSSNGADLAFAMALDTATSDIYITGATAFDYSGTSGEDYTTVKYNSAGVEQWVRDHKGTGAAQDEASVIATDPQGNVIVSGYTFGVDAVGCITIKYDPLGNEMWVAHYAGESNIMAQPGGVIADRSGNVYITGFAINNAGLECFTLKYNSAGVQQWLQLYHSSNRGKDIALDADGNVYVVGVGYSATSNVTIKYSPEGEQKWVQLQDGSSEAAIAVNKFNDVFVTGSSTNKYSQPKPLIVTPTPDTTVYYGYGSNCVQLKAGVTGGVAPYSFTWWPGGSTPNNSATTVCPTATSIYRVIVQDAVGKTDTARLTVKVIDVRCGDKVVVCHNGKDLYVAPSAVAAHLQHGDKLGSCSLSTSDCDKLKNIYVWHGGLPLKFTAYPNPFGYLSTLIYQLPLDAQVTISLTDVNGRAITTLVREKKRAGCYFAFIDGRKLVPGTYICRMVISIPGCQSVQTLKLVVVK